MPMLSQIKNFWERKKIIALTLFTTSFCALSAQAIQLSLEDILNRIENENLQVLVQREAVEQSLQSANMQRAKLLPQVSLQIQHSTSRSASPFGSNQLTTVDSTLTNGQVAGTLSLFDLRRYADFQLAKSGHKISELAAKAVTQDVMNQAAATYFTHIRNRNLLKVIQANLDLDYILLDIASSKFRAGVASPLDVTRAEVRLASDEKALLVQKTIVRQSELFLIQLLGLDINERIETPDLLQKPNQQLSQSFWSFDEALTVRPDYLKVKKDFERAKLDKKAAYWDQLPTVSAFANWGYAATDLLNDNKRQIWAGGVMLSVPLFDGFSNQSNIIAKGAQERSRRYTLQDLENTIKTTLSLSQFDETSRFAEIKIAVKQLELAEKELELARSNFQSGVSSNQEVVEAQSRLAAAQDGNVNSLYQYYLSRLESARVMGNVRHILQD